MGAEMPLRAPRLHPPPVQSGPDIHWRRRGPVLGIKGAPQNVSSVGEKMDGPPGGAPANDLLFRSEKALEALSLFKILFK